MLTCKRAQRLSSLRRYLSTDGGQRRRIEDEGDWCYSPEWWQNESFGDTVFTHQSDHGNGVVSVVASPSSRPSKAHWPGIQQLLQQRYKDIYPNSERNEDFRVLGYQWRALRFNEDTRQSTVKVMAISRESEPDQVFIAQQAHCLAIPYPKSMISAGFSALLSCNYDLKSVVLRKKVISAGFSALLSCNYDLKSVVLRKKVMNILCIGHGGGSIPLYLASKILGANVHVVEIDPIVISASTQAMGFPSFSVMNQSGKHALSEPDLMSKLMWQGVHERLFLHQDDAENFILKTNNNNNKYDIVFIDAYDGEDIFPHKLWDPQSPFLKALEKQLHPEHGTVVVNLHADYDEANSSSISSLFDPILPMGKYVSRVCKAYKDTLVRNGSGTVSSGFAFTVNVPWVCNASLVVCKSSENGILNRDVVLNRMASKSHQVENLLKLPFSCLEYIMRGFTLVD